MAKLEENTLAAVSITAPYAINHAYAYSFASIGQNDFPYFPRRQFLNPYHVCVMVYLGNYHVIL